jgi:hypothetical protein
MTLHEQIEQIKTGSQAITQAERIFKVAQILREVGISMIVGGCDCCGSPWVTFKFRGETILDDATSVHIDTEEHS